MSTPNEEMVTVTKAAWDEAQNRDGNWLDKWGCCRVCDGEIPHGHTNECDIFKMEQRIRELQEDKRKALEFATGCNAQMAKAQADLAKARKQIRLRELHEKYSQLIAHECTGSGGSDSSGRMVYNECPTCVQKRALGDEINALAASLSAEARKTPPATETPQSGWTDKDRLDWLLTRGRITCAYIKNLSILTEPRNAIDAAMSASLGKETTP